MKDKFFSSSVFGCMDVVKHPATFCPSFAYWRGFLSRVFLHSLYLTTNDTWCLLTFFNVMKVYIKPVCDIWDNMREFYAIMACRSCIFMSDYCPDYCPYYCWIYREFWLSRKWYQKFGL